MNDTATPHTVCASVLGLVGFSAEATLMRASSNALAAASVVCLT